MAVLSTNEIRLEGWVAVKDLLPKSIYFLFLLQPPWSKNIILNQTTSIASNMSQDPTLNSPIHPTTAGREVSLIQIGYYHYYALPRSLRWHSMDLRAKPKPAVRPSVPTICPLRQGLSPPQAVPASCPPIYNWTISIYAEELFPALEIMTAKCLIQYLTQNKCAGRLLLLKRCG